MESSCYWHSSCFSAQELLPRERNWPICNSPQRGRLSKNSALIIVRSSEETTSPALVNELNTAGHRSRQEGTTSLLHKPIISSPKVEQDNTALDTELAFLDYQVLFTSQRSETVEAVELRVVEGSVPADLEGTYYLGGPGLFSDDHGSSVHPLDGHGFLRRFHIQAGSVFYTARYVDTEARREEYDEEKNSWRFTYRGPFSVLRNGERLGNFKVMKNVANTSVLSWAGRLMCFWEGGQPYEVDSQSLHTIGLLRLINPDKMKSTEEGRDRIPKSDSTRRPNLSDFFKLGILQLSARVLNPILSGIFKMPQERVLSHYKIDAMRKRLILVTSYAEDMLLPMSNFSFYEFDSSMNLVQDKKFVIYDHLIIHDWALTENHYIIFANRIRLDIGGSVAAISGLAPMIRALSLNPSNPNSLVYLLPRFSNGITGERDWRIPIQIPKQFWLLHTANAYEELDHDKGSLEIVVQATICSYRWFSFQNMFGYDWTSRQLDPGYMNNSSTSPDGEPRTPHLVRVSIKIDPRHNNSRYSSEVKSFKGWTNSCDFPSINMSVSGYKNRYIYIGGCSGSRRSLQHFPFDSVVKLKGTELEESASIWWAGKRSFLGEPMFVSRPSGLEEDDGYILVIQYAVWKRMCYLVILDAKRIGEKNALIAKLEVPKGMDFPLGFHGFWVQTGEEERI